MASSSGSTPWSRTASAEQHGRVVERGEQVEVRAGVGRADRPRGRRATPRTRAFQSSSVSGTGPDRSWCGARRRATTSSSASNGVGPRSSAMSPTRRPRVLRVLGGERPRGSPGRPSWRRAGIGLSSDSAPARRARRAHRRVGESAAASRRGAATCTLLPARHRVEHEARSGTRAATATRHRHRERDDLAAALAPRSRPPRACARRRPAVAGGDRQDVPVERPLRGEPTSRPSARRPSSSNAADRAG